MVMAINKSQWCRFHEGSAAIRGTLICALVVLFLDVVLDGCYLFSALVCPIWFLASVVRAIARYPGRGVAAARVIIPVATGLLVVANYSVQERIAMASAARVIQACERYREANGAYPEQLNALVPCYLNSIPRAKNCCSSNKFLYVASPEQHTLFWYKFPPFGRMVYTLETGRWHYLD